MFKLPFHVDTPLASGLAALAAVVLFLCARLAYDHNIMRIGDALGWWFERKFGAQGPEKGRRVGRAFLLVMAVLFGAMALFGIAVGTGVIRNGDAPAPITIEEFMERHGN